MKSFAKNVMTIKNDNRAMILSLLRFSPLSRADISKRCGLSKSSVTMIINSLISEGIIREIGTDEAVVGRKPILLDIVADYKYAAGVMLGRHEVRVCLTDLKGEMLCSVFRSIKEFTSQTEILDYICQSVDELIKDFKFKREDCIGIGVGCPGPLSYGEGVILSPPELDILKNMPIAAELKKRTGLNVLLENNAVLLALREAVLQHGNKLLNFMSVIISHGIGSAVVSNGEIYRGFAGFSGEVGHISVVADGIDCPCGNKGCLERYVTLSAVKEKFGFEHYHEIVDKAYLKDEFSLGVLDYIVKYLGAGLVTAVNLFDLDAVILHGEYSYRPSLLNEKLEKYINEKSLVAASHGVKIITPDEKLEKEEGNSTAAILKRYFDQKL